MKKFVSILLAVVLIFSVLTCVGCEADKKEENTITYYHYEPYVSPVSILIYQYNEKCENVQNRCRFSHKSKKLFTLNEKN